MFYDGKDTDPPDSVVEADILAILRYASGSVPKIIEDIRQHFNGNVSDIRIQTAITKLNGM